MSIIIEFLIVIHSSIILFTLFTLSPSLLIEFELGPLNVLDMTLHKVTHIVMTISIIVHLFSNDIGGLSKAHEGLDVTHILSCLGGELFVGLLGCGLGGGLELVWLVLV